MAIPKESAKTLLKIIHGDVKDLKIPVKNIITSRKLQNKILRLFVEEYRRIPGVSERSIMEVILAMDEAIEKDYLTNELLDEVRKNPSILNIKSK